MSAGRSALVFGDIQTDRHGAETVHGVVRWLYASLTLFSSISNGILQQLYQMNTIIEDKQHTALRCSER